MSVKFEKLEGNTGKLTIEVPVEEFDKGLDKAFKKVVTRIVVPGFRKGKVPRQMFERMYGVESLYQDALDEILPQAYARAVEESGAEPVDRPEIEIEKMEKGEPILLTATFPVKPEVELGDYKSLEAKRESADVTDEDVEELLKGQRARFAEMAVKESAIESGDTAVIDFEGFVGDEAFEGGKGEDYPLEIGSGQFIPGFEEQLIGAAPGESKDVVVTFPEEYHAEELAGKEATFKVTVKEVKEQVLPELDDDFAKEVDATVNSLEELRAKMKETTAEQRKNEVEANLRDALIETASKNAKVDVPSAMVDSEVDRMVEEFSRRLEMQGMNMELYTQFTGQGEEELRGQMKEEAQDRVRATLVLEAIADKEGLTAEPADVEEELEKMAATYDMKVDDIKKALGGTTAIEGDVRNRKTVEFLVEHANIIE